MTYRVRSFITLPISQLTLTNGSDTCTSRVSVSALTRHKLSRGPRFRVGAAPSRFFPRAPGRFLAELPVHFVVGNIAASVRSPHQYPCVHPSRRIPQEGHGQRRAGLGFTTPDGASPIRFCRQGRAISCPPGCPCRPIVASADWVCPGEFHPWEPTALPSKGVRSRTRWWAPDARPAATMPAGPFRQRSRPPVFTARLEGRPADRRFF